MTTTLPLQLSAGRHAILLFHGLSSTPLELQYLARGLNRAGYTVRLPVIDGYSHGRPAATRRRFSDWVQDALSEFDAMRDKFDSVSVGGLCMGAGLALSVAAQRSSSIAGVMALSTTLHFDGWANPWSRRLLPLAPYLPFAGRIGVKETEPFGLKDERLRKFISAQMRISGGSDAGAATLRVRDLVEAQRLMRSTRRNLSSICAPTLVVHAREDDVATPRSAYDVVTGVRSSRVQCVMLDDSYHMISIDQEKAKVLEEMKDFMAECTQGVGQSGDKSEVAAPSESPARRLAVI
jgi:carboxylesterase